MKNLTAVRTNRLLQFAFTALLCALAPLAAHAQSSIDWEKAIQYAKLVNISESVEPTAEYTAVEKNAIGNLGYNYLTTIYGRELATDINPNAGATVSYGFIATNNNGEMVVIVRGTDTTLEWIHDAAFLFVATPIKGGKGLTEDGFTAIYKSLRTGKASGSPTVLAAVKALVAAGGVQGVTVSGHSLGGALATLIVDDLAHNASTPSLQTYTFASPQVGEYFFVTDFNKKVAASYRVYNVDDLVPYIPTYPYLSTKSAFKLTPSSKQVKDTVACEHHLTTYLWLMGQKAGVYAGDLNSECVAN